MKTSIKGWWTEMRRPTPHRSHWALRVALLAILLGSLGFVGSLGLPGPSVAARSHLNIGIDDAPGSLVEIKDRHFVALLISRSSVLDASGSDAPLIAEALAAEPREARRHRYPYRLITTKLNDYIRKYRSLRPVNEIAQADFIIYFKLLEYRRVLNGFYPYGELFVIVNPRPEELRPARVIWKTKKVMFAEDAVKDFVKELKRVRQER